MNPKHKALELRNKFRLFIGEGKDADGDFVNDYLVAKHVAKRSALLAVGILADNSDSTEKVNYWCAVKAELERL